MTRLITSVSYTFQPIRAHANVTADTCGNTVTLSWPNSRIRVEPIPCNNGSPLATTCRSAPSGDRPCTAGSIGVGHSQRSAVTVSSSRASCRFEP
ncbi:Uncharacterised protein [Mycobacterium tuberculosis]|nr:Uncharacterised protein [Mycobacterium tuberculosis]